MRLHCNFRLIFGSERYDDYKLQNEFGEKKIQITDDNELQAALHLMYKQCPEDDSLSLIEIHTIQEKC